MDDNILTTYSVIKTHKIRRTLSVHFNEWLHFILIFFGVFILFQHLLVKRVENSAILFQIVNYLDEGAVLLLFTLIAVLRIIKGKFLIRTNINLLLIVFLITGFASSIINSTPAFIYFSQFLLYIKGFLVFYIFAHLSIDTKWLRKYIIIFFWVGVIFLSFGIVDFFIPYSFRAAIGNISYVTYRNNMPSVVSFFDHPAVFGWFMGFIALYCFAFFLIYKRLTYLIIGLMFFIGCFLSLRAKAITGLIIAVSIGFILLPVKKKKKSIMIVFLFLLIIGVILLGSSILSILQLVVNSYITSDNTSDIARNMLYIKGFEIAKDYFPFGAGFGRYGSWISHVYYSPIYIKYGLSEVWGMSKNFANFISDTFWPMVIGETGFIGFAIFSIIMITIIVSAYRRAKYSTNNYIKAVQFGTFLILIESFVESIASPIYVYAPFYIFIFGVAGISYALFKYDKPMIKK